MTLKEKYKLALVEFVEKAKLEEVVVGIFVSGSYVHDELYPNSDLDVFIVTNDVYMQVLAVIIDEIELECCYKPLKQYYYDIESTRNPVDIQRFSAAEIVYDPKGEVQQLIERAKEIFLQGPNININDGDLYHLNDRFLDLEDRLHTPYGRILLFKAFEQLVKVYFKKENLWECKISHLIINLKAHSFSFGELVEEFLNEQDLNKQYKELKYLKELVLTGLTPLDLHWKTARVIAPAVKEDEGGAL